VGCGRPGSLRLTAQRELFAASIARGVSNSAGCREGGINRRTGTRLRFGRAIPASGRRTLHHAPVLSARRTTISARYLSEDERLVIGDLRRAGLSVRAIAAERDRAPSTVSRELRRNRDDSSGRYRAFTAHKLAATPRARPRARRIAADLVFREFVQDQLTATWSPEQISHALSVQFPGEPSASWCPRASTKRSTPANRG
jgi:transposase, IS30 family